jgi:hypothetical protein
MKPIKHLRSLGLGLIFGLIFASSAQAGPREATALVAMAFIGTLVPNLDLTFATRLSRGNWITNAFLIPFLMSLAMPKSLFISAFFIGYSAHVVNDLDKQGNMEFAFQRAAVGLLWFLSIVFIMGTFGMTFNAAISKLFG